MIWLKIIYIIGLIFAIRTAFDYFRYGACRFAIKSAFLAIICIILWPFVLAYMIWNFKE